MLQTSSEERGLCLIHLLISCANYVAIGNFENANVILDQISNLASPEGDSMQRMASYFAESLADRILKNWSGLYRAFHSTRRFVLSDDVLVRKMFAEFLPFMKVSYVISNQAIVESMEGERMVHVIDLNAGEPAQWCALVRDLSARPEGAPHLRITGVHQHKEVLEHMSHVLTQEAEKFDLPFQFNAIVSKLDNLDIEKLRVKTGEALAITSSLQLHTLLAPDEDVLSGYHPSEVASNLHRFLRSLHGLCPKLMVVTEQDRDHNGKNLMDRLSESLYFYAALFDCMESALPRSSLERVKIEKMILGEEIMNIVACEGAERKERHEKLEKWSVQFDLAGFVSVPLSYQAMLQAGRLLQSYECDGYRIKEENGRAMVICWHDQPLYAVSAWRFRR